METNLAHGDMKLKLEKLFNNSVYRFQLFPVFPFLFPSIQFLVFVLFLFWLQYCALWFKNRSKMSTWPTNLFGPFRLLTFSGVSGGEGEALKHLRLVPPSFIYVAIENI